jgi:hypothetical protein
LAIFIGLIIQTIRPLAIKKNDREKETWPLKTKMLPQEQKLRDARKLIAKFFTEHLI